jgi:hypothetical protein
MARAPAVIDVWRGLASVRRSLERTDEMMRLHMHEAVCRLGRQWLYPEFVLEDDEIEALQSRALGRTLAEIHDLPEVIAPE